MYYSETGHRARINDIKEKGEEAKALVSKAEGLVGRRDRLV